MTETETKIKNLILNIFEYNMPSEANLSGLTELEPLAVLDENENIIGGTFDSLDVVEIFSRVEQEFPLNEELSIRNFGSPLTIKDLAKYVDEHKKE
jgi:acyl carrier protein